MALRSSTSSVARGSIRGVTADGEDAAAGRVVAGGTDPGPDAGGPGGRQVSDYALRLYVVGRSPRAGRAIANLQRICDGAVAGRVEVEIVDVVEHPQRAEDARIIATPTLVREHPLPQRRVIGDLSDIDKVMMGLDLRPATEGVAR